jgi:hypothetical protein
MKCIIKAMNENTQPKKKWWGFLKGNKRYLCRYHHIFAIFSETEVLYYNYETKTDKAGVMFAINYFNQNQTNEIKNTN